MAIREARKPICGKLSASFSTALRPDFHLLCISSLFSRFDKSNSDAAISTRHTNSNLVKSLSGFAKCGRTRVARRTEQLDIGFDHPPESDSLKRAITRPTHKSHFAQPEVGFVATVVCTLCIIEIQFALTAG